MKALLAVFEALVLTLLMGCATSAHAVDVAQIEKDLGAGGVVGWIHGAVGDRDLFVFTYRNPTDFFDNIQMSLVPENAAVAAELKAFTRHDQVRIKGSFMKNPSPQKHVLLTSVEVVKVFTNPYAPPAYEHEAKIPTDLETLDRANFMVHAIASEGHILVVEYKDQVLPIWVKDEKLSKDLSRGDVVAIRFKIKKDPGQPTHLKILETEPDAVVRLQSVKDMHGKPASVEGALIMFPASPDIKFNVFALEDTSYPGVKRQFTLLNQDDPKIFKEIRDKLQAAWDRHPKDFVNGRNKLLSTKIRVTASGTFQEVDPNQANVQVLLKSANDIQLNEAP
ncbi:MAG: hypothetical protein AAB250_04380 [Bdellovibrionota bacterium]